MKIVYTSYWGTYSALLKAMIRVCAWTSLPPYEDKRIPISLFCKASYGDLLYIGVDEKLNEVYILGHRGLSDVIENALWGLQKIFDLRDDDVIFIDTQGYEDPWDSLFIRLINHGICSDMLKRALYKKFQIKLERGEIPW